jgi:hypothetical protein
VVLTTLFDERLKIFVSLSNPRIWASTKNGRAKAHINNSKLKKYFHRCLIIIRKYSQIFFLSKFLIDKIQYYYPHHTTNISHLKEYLIDFIVKIFVDIVKISIQYPTKTKFIQFTMFALNKKSITIIDDASIYNFVQDPTENQCNIVKIW